MSDFTKDAIVTTFIALLAEKPFDHITVTEIAQRCHISRRTFYYHFQDLYALVEELFRREAQRAVKEYGVVSSWEDGFIAASQFILENRTAIYHIYNSSHRRELELYVDRLATQVMDEYLDAQSQGREIKPLDRHLICTFYKNALSGMVYQWLERGMQDDPEIIILRLGLLLHGNIQRSLEISEQY